jgi:hypothetical protein
MRPLSILDLSPVTTGTSGAQALRNTLDLARITTYPISQARRPTS